MAEGDNTAGSGTLNEQFYRRILELHDRNGIERLIDDALKLVVEMSGAQIAYLEIFGADDGPPAFWRGHSLTDASLEGIRARISAGVVGFAIAEGRTIHAACARNEGPFQDLDSVKQNEIDAVLCAPIGVGLPVGVLYLQGRPVPGPFPELDRKHVEMFCHQLALVAAQLLGLTLTEETEQFERRRAREALARNDGNISATARELKIGRAWLRKLLRQVS